MVFFLKKGEKNCREKEQETVSNGDMKFLEKAHVNSTL